MADNNNDMLKEELLEKVNGGASAMPKVMCPYCATIHGCTFWENLNKYFCPIVNRTFTISAEEA